MRAIKAVIIADDLTGALDAAAPFAALGWSCLAATTPEAVSTALDAAPEVLSVNLGSREGAPDDARARAAEAAALLQDAGSGAIWLKKIDSRLKGHVRNELDGLVAATGHHRILVCPAIPDLGRVVRDGMVCGAGVTEPISVAQALALRTAECPDAESDADLDRIVQRAAPGSLFVGARGLAAALARRLGAGVEPVVRLFPPRPLSFLIGSRDPVTAAQVEILRRAEDGPPWCGAPDGLVPIRALPEAVIVQAVPGSGASGTTVSQRLACGFLKHHHAVKGTLVVTGGETAAAMLDAAGIRLLRVRGEVAPGMPLCDAVGSGFPALVTKSGGFGDPDALLRLWRDAVSQEGQP